MEKKKLCDVPQTLVVHPALRGFLAYSLYKTALRLRCGVNDALTRFKLVGPQIGILRVLEAAGPASQVDLGRSLGIDKASMVKLLDGLEREGLVTRETAAGDRRVKRIVVTAVGQKRLKESLKVVHGVEEDFLGPLSAADRATLRRVLDKLLR